MKNAKILLIEGHHDISTLTEISGKAHILTRKGTLKLRECSHSNTFIVGATRNSSVPERNSSIITYKPAIRIYEAVPLDIKQIYVSLPEQTLQSGHINQLSFTDLSNTIALPEISELIRKYSLLHIQADDTILVARIAYSSIIKIIQYMQSLQDVQDFDLFGGDQNAKIVRDWAIRSFTGCNAELGYFIARAKLQTLDKSILKDGMRKRALSADFMKEWREKSLYEPDILELKKIILERESQSFMSLAEECLFKTCL